MKHLCNVFNWHLCIHKNVENYTLLFFQNIQSNINQVNYELADIFQVSRVRIEQDEQLVDTNYSLVVSETSLYKCDRCRKVLAEVKDVLCQRCSLVVQRIEDNLHAVSN